MSLLPKVPTDLQGKNKDYLIELVRQLEGELRRRPATQEGQLIIASSRPLTYYDDAGVAYRMGEDVFPPGLGTSDLDTNGGEVVTVDGDPVLRDSDLDINSGELVTVNSDPVLRDSGLAANGGSIPETDESNTFSGTQTVTSPIVLDGEGWTAPTLQNGWVNYGGSYSTAGYRKLSSGMVVLKGLIKDGTTTAGTVLFVLPVGYRPTEQLLCPSVNNNNIGRVDVRSNGEVIAGGGVAAGWLTLEGVRFFAEQ